MAENSGYSWESFPDAESRLIKAYEVVAAHYRQDVLMYWTRLSVFLVVQAGLLAVVGSVDSEDGGRATVFATVGAGISVVWFLVARASVWWIAVWRRQIVELDAIVNPLASYAADLESRHKNSWARLRDVS